MPKKKTSPREDQSTNTSCPFPACNITLALKAPGWEHSDQWKRSAVLPGQKGHLPLCYCGSDTWACTRYVYHGCPPVTRMVSQSSITFQKLLSSVAWTTIVMSCWEVGTYNRGNWAALCRPRQYNPAAPQKQSLQRWPVKTKGKVNDYTPLHAEWQIDWVKLISKHLARTENSHVLFHLLQI